MKEAAECNQKDVEELLQDSFQRHSMLKILFTLNGAKTTQHLLTRIEQLMTYLSDSNKTADGGDHLISRVYSNFTYILYLSLLVEINIVSVLRVDGHQMKTRVLNI